MRRTKVRMGLGLTAGLAVAIVVGLLLAIPLNAAASPVAPSPTSAGATAVPSAGAAASAKPVTWTSCSAGDYPQYVTYDPVNRYFYVDNVEPGSISVYKGTCTLIYTISLPAYAQPRGNAYDPSNNYIYVADTYLNQLYVISGTKVIQTITSTTYYGLASLDGPWGVAYDPAGGFYGGSGTIVVTNNVGNTIALFATPAPATGSTLLFDVMPVGACPSGVVYDPFFNQVMVTNLCSDNVTAIDGTIFTVDAAGIPVGKDPQGIAYDPSTEDVYVANSGGKNVTVISDDTVVKSIKVGSGPIDVAFDQSNLHLYVVNYVSGTVSVIGLTNKVTSTITLPTDAEPVGVAWDGANGHVLVTDFFHDDVYSIS